MPDSNVLNLTEYALLEDKPGRARATAMVFIKSKSVMTDIKVKTDNSLKSEGMRHIGLEAGPDWVDLNTALTTVKNLPKPWAEQVFMTGFKVDLPQALIESKGSGGEARLFSKLVVPALEYFSADFNYKFFNNRRAGATGSDKDTECFNGLRYRLSATGRSLYDIPSECKIQCSADLTAANISSANVFKVAKALSNALEIMGSESGDGVTFYANESVWSAIEASFLLTSNSLFGNDKDAFGQTILTYRGAKLRRAGRGVPSATGTQSQVLPNTESSDGETLTGSTYTSIFGVKSGEDSFMIKQFKESSPSDPKMLEDMITKRVAWWNFYGLEQPGTRSVVQIYGLTAS